MVHLVNIYSVSYVMCSVSPARCPVTMMLMNLLDVFANASSSLIHRNIYAVPLAPIGGVIIIC